MSRSIRFVAVAMIAVFSLIAVPMVSASDMIQEPQATISTSGMGVVNAEPDMATFSVGMEARNETLKPAQDEVTNEANAITAMLIDAGIEEKDIVTSSYQVTPENKYDRNGNFLRIENYVVRMAITITVHDLDLVGSLLDQSVSLGADYVSDITFSVADPTSYIQEARQAAIGDARMKAEDYAMGSDSTLTGLFSLYESRSPMPLARDGSGEAPMADMAESTGASEDANPVEVSAGTTTFTVQIETTWTIEPNGTIDPDATPAN